MTAIIAQWINGRIYVLEEIYLKESNTLEMCERFEERASFYLQQYRAANGNQPLPVTVYGDATGNFTGDRKKDRLRPDSGVFQVAKGHQLIRRSHGFGPAVVSIVFPLK